MLVLPHLIKFEKVSIWFISNNVDEENTPLEPPCGGGLGLGVAPKKVSWVESMQYI